MTDIIPSKCIAADCNHEAAINSPLCILHKEKLEKIEAGILKDATRTIRSDLRQFERLLYVEPPLHSAEIAFRMAEPMRKVKELLKRFKDDRV